MKKCCGCCDKPKIEEDTLDFKKVMTVSGLGVLVITILLITSAALVA